jgi:hypothetical protein
VLAAALSAKDHLMSARTPITTSDEMAVARRSSGTRTTVRSQDQQHDRLAGATVRSMRTMLSSLTPRLNHRTARPVCGAPSLSTRRADAVDKLRRRQRVALTGPQRGSSFRSSDPCHGSPAFAALVARAFLSGPLAVFATRARKCRIKLAADQILRRTPPSTRGPERIKSIVDSGDYAASIPIGQRTGVAP